LLRYRVIVVTLATATRMVSASLPEGHFTHVFVDEAGQATEPQTIIPLGGLVDCRTQVVISGDPFQLGPVVHSSLAKEYGYETSLLERLMALPAYQPISNDAGRNPKMITKLLNNFRSHPTLLELPSRLFYDGELKACVPKDRQTDTKLLSLPWVPRAASLETTGSPIIFHGVRGEHARSANTPSLFNQKEALLVVHYAQQLKAAGVVQGDVGIVSPYRRQVRLMKDMLANQLKWDNVVVGSTEEFQGQERDVIILSTVRSSVKKFAGIGFLANQRRFNVAITRAKTLLIVIGDPYMLNKNKHWRALIRHAQASGGYIGCPFGNGKYKSKKR